MFFKMFVIVCYWNNFWNCGIELFVVVFYFENWFFCISIVDVLLKENFEIYFSIVGFISDFIFRIFGDGMNFGGGGKISEYNRFFLNKVVLVIVLGFLFVRWRNCYLIIYSLFIWNCEIIVYFLNVDVMWVGNISFLRLISGWIFMFRNEKSIFSIIVYWGKW